MIVTISKGQQVTIPAAWRKKLKLKAGSRVEMLQRAGRIVIRPVGEDIETVFERANKWKPKVKIAPAEMDTLFENEIYR